MRNGTRYVFLNVNLECLTVEHESNAMCESQALVCPTGTLTVKKEVADYATGLTLARVP
jgi:hypothetical protein